MFGYVLDNALGKVNEMLSINKFVDLLDFNGRINMMYQTNKINDDILNRFFFLNIIKIFLPSFVLKAYLSLCAHLSLLQFFTCIIYL